MSYRHHFTSAIGKLEAERRYRVFADLERSAEEFPDSPLASCPTRQAEEVTIWCSNDYLGMGRHPEVIKTMTEDGGQARCRGPAARETSPARAIRSSSSRAELADLHDKDGALVFTSGWVSNLAAISTIADLIPDCLILSDALNHNSMIEGVRRSSAQRMIFRHNDVAHLEELLRAAGPSATS